MKEKKKVKTIPDKTQICHPKNISLEIINYMELGLSD